MEESMTASSASATSAALSARRGLLERGSRSSQIADIIRGCILDGEFAPGARLSELEICSALGVSRNTLREAFKSLVEERLVTHELNRGVFVRIPTPDDVTELYGCRRVVECAALANLDHASADLTALADALAEGDRHAARGDWTGVGDADVAFHKAISSLNRSARLDRLMTDVWNELRLVFHVMANAHDFHQPYLERNHEIYETVARGETHAAAAQLKSYLHDAEHQILQAYSPSLPEAATGIRR
jgi:DNA-binding GntR family transcriptional regulator